MQPQPPPDAAVPNPDPGAGQATPPGRRLRWLLVGVTAVVVLALFTSGLVAGIVFLGRHRASVQRQEYALGHAAYRNADCDRAIPHLDRALDHVVGSPTWVRADQELRSCRRFVEVRDKAARLQPAAGLSAYLDYLSRSPEALLRPLAQDEIVELAKKVSPEDLVSAELCPATKELQAAGTGSRSVGRWMPPILLACAKAWEKDAPKDALKLYSQVREAYPGTPHEELAEAGTVRVTYHKLEQDGVLSIPRLTDFPGATGLKGRSALLIANGTPNELTVMLSGPDTVIETIPGCSDCKKVQSLEQAQCPRNSTPKMISVDPGRYKVVLKLKGESGLGDWTLKKNVLYSDCWVGFES